MLSRKVQTRILEETEQIPANSQVVLDTYKEDMPRLFQAASLVLSAQNKIEVPDNLWSASQKSYFTENIFRELTNKVSRKSFRTFRRNENRGQKLQIKQNRNNKNRENIARW